MFNVKNACRSENEVLEDKVIPNEKTFHHKSSYIRTPHWVCTVTYPGHTEMWSVFGGKHGPNTPSIWQITNDGISLNWTMKVRWRNEL